METTRSRIGSAGIKIFAAILAVGLSGAIARGATVWHEGEDATVKRVQPHPWYNDVKSSELSGGRWVGNWGDRAGNVGYTLRLPEDGQYSLWVRANPTQSKLSYRIGAGGWQLIDFGEAMGRTNVAADGAVDLRHVAWTKVGKLRLEKGTHRLQFKMHSENHNHGAIDALVLTTTPFTPSGKARPAEAARPGQDVAPQPLLNERNSWAFDPPKDAFSRRAWLDLRRLNEQEAGQSGFIRLSEDGMGFVKGDGAPIRFWSCVSGISGMKGMEMQRHARFLAKQGVNMIRLHQNISVGKEGADIADLNETKIDRIQQAVAAAKRHGIYVSISPYWYHHKMPASWGLKGYEAGDMPTGALFFNQKFQDAYKTWVRELYTRPSPYTGVPLKDEPAVAIIQVKNEDSLLFYTFDRIPAEQKRILGEQYGDWLKEKYGSLEAALRAWDGARVEGDGKEMIADDFENGVAGFYITWFLTQPASGGKARRLADQLQFLAETQRSFYEEMDRFYREELGCKQLTNAMNWKGADKPHVDDAERWSYTACDVVAVNRYTGGLHLGKNRGYRIDPGHRLKNRSILRNPLQLPTNLKQVAGHPFIITECAWTHPNRYQTEGPLMAAAYMGLNGVDSLYWFALGEPTWLRDPRRKFWHVKPGNRGYALDKWSGSVPQQAGMFPANALIHRLGYVRPGRTVVHEERTLEEIWNREEPIIAETESFDPNRDIRDLRGQTAGDVAVSRLAFLVGKVEAVFGGDPTETQVADLAGYIDGDAHTVKGSNGQIKLDYGTGLLRLDAPKAQAVGGFLKDAGGRFELSDVTVESDNDYAVIEVVAMDDRPLAESGEVLVQVGTVARLTGWVTRPAAFEQGGKTVQGREIVYTGRPPWRMANASVTLTIANPGLSSAMLLDEGGYPKRPVPVQKEDGKLTVQLPTNTMYLVLR